MDPMINTGAEREKFSEIVQQVGDTLAYMDKYQIYKDEANINDVSNLLCNCLFSQNDTICNDVI